LCPKALKDDTCEISDFVRPNQRYFKDLSRNKNAHYSRNKHAGGQNSLDRWLGETPVLELVAAGHDDDVDDDWVIQWGFLISRV
jgi:hypothetical protein